jgi:hypothetical protein
VNLILSGRLCLKASDRADVGVLFFEVANKLLSTSFALPADYTSLWFGGALLCVIG